MVAHRNTQAKFDEKWTPEPNTGCWLWLGAVDRGGYGRFSLGGKMKGAHRAAYEFHVGRVPDGLFVCHRCDQPSCVNPGHMFLGTHTDNMRDAIRKGRHVHGERSPNAKLTWAQVREIRSNTEESHAALARRHGVSHQVISDVVALRKWRDSP